MRRRHRPDDPDSIDADSENGGGGSGMGDAKGAEWKKDGCSSTLLADLDLAYLGPVEH